MLKLFNHTFSVKLLLMLGYVEFDLQVQNNHHIT